MPCPLNFLFVLQGNETWGIFTQTASLLLASPVTFFSASLNPKTSRENIDGENSIIVSLPCSAP